MKIINMIAFQKLCVDVFRIQQHVACSKYSRVHPVIYGDGSNRYTATCVILCMEYYYVWASE